MPLALPGIAHGAGHGLRRGVDGGAADGAVRVSDFVGLPPIAPRVVEHNA